MPPDDPATSQLGAAYVLVRQPLFVPVALILMRELYVAGLREFMAGRGVSIAVSSGGKWKTATQMFGILLMLYSMAYAWPQAWHYG
ncbi:CDP-alcohol phosphatidyltransferase family protein, partial [Staphylococcus aureus]